MNVGQKLEAKRGNNRVERTLFTTIIKPIYLNQHCMNQCPYCNYDSTFLSRGWSCILYKSSIRKGRASQCLEDFGE